MFTGPGSSRSRTRGVLGVVIVSLQVVAGGWALRNGDAIARLG